MSTDLYTKDLFDAMLALVESPTRSAVLGRAAQAMQECLAAEYVRLVDAKQEKVAEAGNAAAAANISWEQALQLVQSSQNPTLTNIEGNYIALAPYGEAGVALALGTALTPNSLQRLTLLSQALAKRLDNFAAPTTAPLRAIQPEMMVGQEANQARLLRLLTITQSGQGAAALIQGAVGSGKTVLAKWLLRQASQKLFTTLRVQAEIHAPLYQVWRLLLSKLFPTLNTLSPTLENYRTFLHNLNPEWGVRAGLLWDVMQWGHVKAPALQSYQVEQRRLAALNMLIDLLHHISREQPLVLVVEDAQHLDEASQYLMEQLSHWLMASSAPILLCLTSTTPLEGNFHAIEILPLSESQVQSLARTFGLTEPMPTEIVAPSPWYVHLFSQYLSNITTLAQLPHMHPSLQELLHLQLQQLSESLQMTLFTCAAVGSSFTFPILQALHPARLTAEKLAANLRLLNGWLEEVEPTRFIFQHLTAWQVAHAACQATLKQQLHLALAQQYEQQHSQAVEHISQHYAQSATPHLAQSYLIQVANAAHARAAYQTALEAIAQALALATHPQSMDAFIIRTQEADLYHALGRYDQEVSVLQDLSQIAQTLDDPWLYADNGWRWLRYYHTSNQLSEGIATWHIFHSKAQQAHHTVANAEISITTAQLYQKKGDFVAANRQLDAAVLLAQRTGNMSLGARILFTLGQVFQDAYDYELAQACLEQSMELYRQQGDQVGIANNLLQLGNLYDLLGYYTMASEHFETACKLWLTLGSVAEALTALIQAANVLVEQKNYSKAFLTLRRGDPLLHRVRDPLVEGQWWHQQGRVQQGLNSYPTSLQHYQQALDAYPNPANSSKILTYAALAQASSLAGQSDQSQRWVAQVETLDPQLVLAPYPAWVYLALYDSASPQRFHYLSLGQQRLQEQANRITDLDMRKRYLTRPDRATLMNAQAAKV